LLICTLVGAGAGSASALFLVALDWAGSLRESHVWIIALLPLAGLLIGLVYHQYGREVEAGNNILITEIHTPKKRIPFLMAPLVLWGTVVTHLFGGSAGREGTAVQMGGAIADQLTSVFKLKPRDRRILIITGISAGFASVFGTPIAGAVFGLEVFLIGRIRYHALLPSFLAAIIADAVTTAWGVGHTHYAVPEIVDISSGNLFWALLAGLLFGLASRLFAVSVHGMSRLARALIAYAPLRPFAGGVVIAAAVFLLGHTRYIGLGIPTIEESFYTELPPYDFLLKLVFTAITLGAGFKGGEVTPLFFIGATLGNALSLIIPLPMALLAAMGFVAVFAGASNTPLACLIMGIELFGIEAGVYLALACIVSYYASGHSGIYNSQIIGTSKHMLFMRQEGSSLGSLAERRKRDRL
jgi:H+/Cl- antiporter ClcA